MPYAASPPDTVIAQIPSPGSAKVDRPNVALLLSTPAPAAANSYVMPDLVNLSFTAAAASIAHVGLKLAPPLYNTVAIPDVAAINASALEPPRPPAPPTPPGTVLAQSPSPGARVDARTAIQLTLAQ
jgi:beta-lactam-binding protein with PASTA domain